MKVFDRISEDVRAKSVWVHGDASRRNVLKTWLGDGTPAMVFYRLMQASGDRGFKPLAMFFNKILACFCGCVIGRGAHFGQRFILVHSLGVVINGKVRGGDDVVVEHQVTIGAEKGVCPELGHRVFIGAGAKVLGGVRIGDDVKIGANAVVVTDAPSGVTMVGVPARAI